MRVLLVISLMLAAFNLVAKDIEEIRKEYLTLEKIAQSGSRSAFLKQVAKVQDYPLTPYAESTFLQRNLSLSNQRRIKRLLERYPDAPFSQPLKKKWLNFLADRQLRQAFVEQYTDIGDAKLQCLHLTWQLQNGAAKEDILPKVDDIWIAPYSQPRECNYIFDLWKEAGNLTADKALQRLKLAAKKKNYGLLPYLKTLLPDNQKHLAGLWKSAVARPANVAKNGFFLLFTEQEKEIFVYALNRMVYVAPEKVENLWQELSPKFPVNGQERQKLVKKLAIAFAISNHDDGLDWLLKVPEESVDDSIKQWRLAYSLQQNDWQSTYQVMSDLPEQMQADEAVLYWKARSLEQLGETAWSENAFHELSERRDYYGFLAADKVGKKSNMRHVPLKISDFEYVKVGRSPVMQRAYELFKLGRQFEARKEWNLLAEEFTDREKLAAAKLAHNWGWYDRPIFTLAEVGYFNDVSLRFPLAYEPLVRKNSKRKELDPAFVFAIARRESSFMHDAYSSAGAAGLMQIKPSTASYMAKAKIRKRQLFNPEQNVKLATNYLSYLLDKANGNAVIATAAYNAGFGRVKRWLPEQDMAADAWVETIPYKETRNYVKAVMAYTEVYQQLLENDANLFNDTINLQINPTL